MSTPGCHSGDSRALTTPDVALNTLMESLFPLLALPAISLPTALLLDRLLGEPQRCHPLVGFGHWASRCRQWLQQSLDQRSTRQRGFGTLAWSLAVLPPVLLLTGLLHIMPDPIQTLTGILVLYFTIGWQSLRQHAQAISEPLRRADIPAARTAVSRIVSRDSAALDEAGITKAGMESVLENGSDAIFAPIFWFLLLGPAGALLYRLANTLDAMWGYKTPSLLHFGWCAARIDDVLNYLPARLVVITYALCGKTRLALHCAWQQGRHWKSPNAGPVMAAGAGALGVELGGIAQYFGAPQQRPALGIGRSPKAMDLDRAILLVDMGVGLWVLTVWMLTFAF